MTTVTIYDIAKEANTSISTVSRYLNGKPVRKQTAIKIEQIIKKYDYHPSLIAKGLVSKSMKTIAILLPDIRVYHYAEMAYYLERLFRINGYNSFLCNFPVDDIEKGKSLISMLIARNVDAFVLISSFMEGINNYPEVLELLKDIPVVSENSILNLKNSSSVILDDSAGVKIAIDYLRIQKGRKNIFYVQDTVSKSAEIKKNSFLENYSKIYFKDNNIYLSIRSSEGGYNILKKILQENKDVDAIIYEEEVTAFGGVKACTDIGLLPGRDIDIIGFNKSQYSQVCSPELTYIDTLDEKQANTIFEVLQRMNNLENNKTFQEIITPELVLKKSA